MLPDLSNAIKRFSQAVNLLRTTEKIVNHLPTEIEETIQIQAVIQPADKEKLTMDNLNYSLKYIQVNGLEPLKINDKISYKGTNYRIISLNDFSDYGYFEGIGEEIK